jgi:hypothetical protein
MTVSAEAQLMDDAKRKPVVVLIHGIRDHALWQKEIRDTLESEGFKVVSTNYGRFDLLRFLLPFGFFRRKAASEVLNQLNMVFYYNPGSTVSIIAHSFGTYIIGNIMRESFSLKFDKIILCGSILKYNFPFEQIQDRFSPDIVNEVGTRDVWPAVAESITVGYGSAGTFGFHRPLVYDRWHNGAGHGYFLSKSFCTKYWLPLLTEGAIVADSPSPESPNILVRFINILKIKYVVLAVATYFTYLIAAQSGASLPFASQCTGLPGDTAWIYAGEFDRALNRFKFDPVFERENADLSVEGVSRGEWIRLTTARKTMILDYDVSGTARAMDSPFSLNGKINYTCKVLEPGDRLYVAEVKLNGPSPEENHMWLRVRNTLPGG